MGNWTPTALTSEMADKIAEVPKLTDAQREVIDAKNAEMRREWRDEWRRNGGGYVFSAFRGLVWVECADPYESMGIGMRFND